MKKFFVTLSIFLMCFAFCTSNVFASSVPLSKLNGILGDWYDANGNHVLRIGSDYTLNGYKITAVDYQADTAEGYNITFSKDGKLYEISVTHYMYLGDNGQLTNFRENLEVGDFLLRRTAEPVYLESIGGIYIGMSKEQVVSRYGQPSSADNGRHSNWKYNRQGMEISFLEDAVSSITIYPSGDRRFDRSGLSASNSVSTFMNAYNPGRTMNGSRNTYLFIGRNEVIMIGNNSVTLTMTGPGWAFR